MIGVADTTCFFSFRTVREVTTLSQHAYDHLSFKDTTLDCQENPTIIELWSKVSKTDPFCKRISFNDDLCPAAAMLTYIIGRGGNNSSLFGQGFFASTVCMGCPQVVSISPNTAGIASEFGWQLPVRSVVASLIQLSATFTSHFYR